MKVSNGAKTKGTSEEETTKKNICCVVKQTKHNDSLSEKGKKTGNQERHKSSVRNGTQKEGEGGIGANQKNKRKWKLIVASSKEN